jgi:hypothetical protein
MHTNTTVRPTVKRAALAAILFAAAAMFGSVAIDPAQADARPPRDTEDQLANEKANCDYAKGTWARRGTTVGPGYSCTLPFVNGRQDQWRYNSIGTRTTVCYRFSIDTDWVCV